MSLSPYYIYMMWAAEERGAGNTCRMTHHYFDAFSSGFSPSALCWLGVFLVSWWRNVSSVAKILALCAPMPNRNMEAELQRRKRVALFLCQAKREHHRLMPQELWPPLWVIGRGYPMAPHSSTLAWKIPWIEGPGRLQSLGSWRVRYDWVTSLSLFTLMHWGRKW